MPLQNPFWRRVRDPNGGTTLLAPGEAAPVRDTTLDEARARRMAIQELLAQQNNEMRERQQQQGQFDAEMAQRQAEFGAGLEIDQRRQRLAEANSKADALLGGRAAEVDEFTAKQRAALGNREQDFRESQPNQLDLLRAKYQMDQQAAAGGGLSSHNQQMHTLQSTKLFEEQVAGIREEMSNAPLSPEGQRVWGELSGELRSIEAQRDSLRLPQYNQAIAQWIDKAKRSNLSSMIKPPPTANDILSQQYDPQSGVFVQQDSKGNWQARPILSAEDQRREIALKEKELEWKMRTEGGSGDITSPSVNTLADLMKDPKAVEKLQQQARESIMTRRARQAGDSATPPSEEIEPQELFTEMKRIFDREQTIVELMRGTAPPQPDPAYRNWGASLDEPTRVPPEMMDPGVNVPDPPSEDDIVSPSDMLPPEPPAEEPSDVPPPEAVQEFRQRYEASREQDETGMGYLRRVMRTKQLQGDGSQFLSERALKVGEAIGKDPIEYAAENAADAIRKGNERYHWGTMPEMERKYHERLETPVIPFEGEQLEKALKLLPPGAWYFDEKLNLRQVPKIKQTDQERKNLQDALPDIYRYPGSM